MALVHRTPQIVHQIGEYYSGSARAYSLAGGSGKYFDSAGHSHPSIIVSLHRYQCPRIRNVIVPILLDSQETFAVKCAACHGPTGMEEPQDKLVGGRHTLTTTSKPIRTIGSYWPYATTLYDHIQRAMHLMRRSY